MQKSSFEGVYILSKKEDSQMKCLQKYQWVKLLRSNLPKGKGIMGAWAKLASRAAFRKGQASYCGYLNSVTPGMWSGGIVGLKSILETKSRSKAIETLKMLSDFGYIKYTLDEKTKKLTYKINDWIVECSGAECMNGAVYTTDGYGFLCLPRNITERLVERNYIFDEADAWLDLWCHSVTNDPFNAFSYMAPVIQYGKQGAVLTLETLGQRWGWEKTKVWRFFKKYGDAFSLYRLPGSYGCLIFNKIYPTDREVSLPTYEDILHVINDLRKMSGTVQKHCTDHEHLKYLVTWFSRSLIKKITNGTDVNYTKNRIALLSYIKHVYISQCKYCNSCKYDCNGKYCNRDAVVQSCKIRGPCEPIDLIKLSRELSYYEQTG